MEVVVKKKSVLSYLVYFCRIDFEKVTKVVPCPIRHCKGVTIQQALDKYLSLDVN